MVLGPTAIDFVRRLLQYDGAKRMTASEALAHPFLAPLRQPALEVCDAPSQHTQLLFCTNAPHRNL